MKTINFKLSIVAGMFILSLIISNLLATKLTGLNAITLPAAVLIYPFCFMLGDVLTEVWGYKIARKVIWLGFAAQLAVIFFTFIGIYLPVAEHWHNQSAYEAIFFMTPRILLGSFLGYLAGELCNSWIMDKMKNLDKSGKQPLWVRTISSSAAGQVFDTALFITIAFYGVIPLSSLAIMIVAQYVFKLLCEALLGTPLAYLLIKWAKK